MFHWLTDTNETGDRSSDDETEDHEELPEPEPDLTKSYDYEAQQVYGGGPAVAADEKEMKIKTAKPVAVVEDTSLLLVADQTFPPAVSDPNSVRTLDVKRFVCGAQHVVSLQMPEEALVSSSPELFFRTLDTAAVKLMYRPGVRNGYQVQWLSPEKAADGRSQVRVLYPNEVAGNSALWNEYKATFSGTNANTTIFI